MPLTGITVTASGDQIGSKICSLVCKGNPVIFREGISIQRLATIKTSPSEILNSPKPLLKRMRTSGPKLPCSPRSVSMQEVYVGFLVRALPLRFRFDGVAFVPISFTLSVFFRMSLFAIPCGLSALFFILLRPLPEVTRFYHHFMPLNFVLVILLWISLSPQFHSKGFLFEPIRVNQFAPMMVGKLVGGASGPIFQWHGAIL